MLVLYETPAGYALFNSSLKLDNDDLDAISSVFEDSTTTNQKLKLKAFHKFKNTTEALKAVTGIVEGKLDSTLSDFLEAEIKNNKLSDILAVADAKLGIYSLLKLTSSPGSAIAKKLGLKVISDHATFELMRGIRSQIDSLLTGLDKKDLDQMVLGLSHSLSRYKLKFSPDKVDTMIIQAINLLDDLDKELNTYSMRVKEWYGWHFPEMQKIITDNKSYAMVVQKVGFRTNFETADLSDILTEELEAEIKLAAEISMGTEISDMDIENIVYLCDQVVDITEYRGQLFDYLKNRMAAIAPNLTAIVGEIVGAKLIAHAGSLLSLSKYPASTVQILGAEKALFRALKTKHDTPKYGLIYHASLVGQAAPKIKGKIARTVATKAALCIRVDALSDATTENSGEIGAELRHKVENRLRQLEGKAQIKSTSSIDNRPIQKKFEAPAANVASYNDSSDMVLDRVGSKESPVVIAEEDKKIKKDKKRKADDAAEVGEKKKKDKKRKVEEIVEENASETPEKKKKKKKSKDQ